jgi:GTPase Era involved in 16S rRNA processing
VKDYLGCPERIIFQKPRKDEGLLKIISYIYTETDSQKYIVI